MKFTSSLFFLLGEDKLRVGEEAPSGGEFRGPFEERHAELLPKLFELPLRDLLTR
jgi:hypothetical protein